ncbi:MULTISPECIES: crotonase/enoyl-CoA hydratase family protein [Xanthomonas translucens group]|uniref:Enoyl-CoA hydratase n=1 Tax=Xanthomonas cerealis pv. cerealis TaxID=152263 RepID=A0A514ECX9_9XANT|nr:crotonase/enoyl-CoA hydratase family protein [Xanthomonas translucens]ELQ17027.1 enoyl-CoA hydratase [Xanthomonas translucens DAR61454]MBC3972569.1 crotonase/enoyl-CoA hydratase family protein [Xanthomonas translucens pv. undulosa]MCT8269937.1 crotonase/enoyl-CoA hydratase family protein [Xanthomonas translucens pv. undulosa]MCT8281045.1 crotonase/enoyl-CoA hydratase family protein [Xanthomonas translucens pv. undulosa]MCT8315857.1 crotonase/enoyl-CoA hydratase family protein [Xanthomonas t
MSMIDTLPRTRPYSTLRVDSAPTGGEHWIYMHANQGCETARPCFSSQLVHEIVHCQKELKQRLDRENKLLPHVILASDASVFNLGGDLGLFSQLILSGDRHAMLHYARECVLGVHAFHIGLDAGAHSIALVQGNAMGGGFEAALSCHTIVAEKGVLMGLPEVLFDLFPGMGAYSFLCQRISAHLAEKIMLEGNLYTAEQLLQMGLVDVVVPPGEGVAAVQQIIRDHQRIPHARAAMHKVRRLASAVSLEELMKITEVWVDTAMQLGDRSLRTMNRLVRAQTRRSQGVAA